MKWKYGMLSIEQIDRLKACRNRGMWQRRNNFVVGLCGLGRFYTMVDGDHQVVVDTFGPMELKEQNPVKS
jgi:hypothetical protein